MAAKMTETSQEATAVSRREEFSDFSLVLEDGRELKCHKTRLAEGSPVFRMILKQNGEEARTNKMKMTEFEPATVESFLDYIYADLELMVKKGSGTYTKNFDNRKLTLDLLRMSHMYEVTNLLEDCIAQVANTIVTDNVVDIWRVGENLGIHRLKKQALNHLGKDPKRMLKVPGLKEALESAQLRESLVSYMAGRMIEA